MNSRNRIPLQLVIIEDSADDAELMVAQLRRSNYDPTWQRIETADEFRICLDSPIDLILADFVLPQFDGLTALQMVRERDLDTPFILVSGSVGEDVAVQAMQAGAADYFLKDRLGRLGPAVEQNVRSAGINGGQRRRCVMNGICSNGL